MEIQYRKSNGELGSFDSYKLSRVDVDCNTFTLTFGWYEYDFWNEEIEDVIEIRI